MQNPYFFFDNPLLVNELIKQGIDINKLIEGAKSTQEAIDRLSAYVDTLDEAVHDEVIVQLTNMINDGTMESILSQVLDDKMATLTLSRKFRRIYVSGKHSAYYNPQISDFAYWTQGACSYYDGNTKKIATVSPRYNTKSHNTAVLRVYDTNGTLLNYGDVVTGHSNSITYKDGYFYIVEASRYVNNNSVISYYCHKISANDFNVDETITTAKSLKGIYCHTDILYCTDGENIYTLDFENNRLETIITIPEQYHFWGDGLQDFMIDDNYYYLQLVQPNCVYRIDRNTNTLNFIYNIPAISQDYYHVGEVEGITIDDVTGEWDIFSAIDLETSNLAQHSVLNYFTADIKHNVKSGYHTLYTASKYTTLYVRTPNSERYNNTKSVNPNGSATAPFEYLQEAVNYACANNLFNNYTIFLDGINQFNTTIGTNKAIVINIWATDVDGTTINATNINVGGFYCWGANLTLQNLNIMCSLSTSDSVTQCISLLNSKLRIQSCYVHTLAPSNVYKDVSRGINCYMSDVTYYYVQSDAEVIDADHNRPLFSWANNSTVTHTSGGQYPALPTT